MAITLISNRLYMTTPCGIGVCYMLSYSRGSGFDSRLGLVAVDQSCQ